MLLLGRVLVLLSKAKKRQGELSVPAPLPQPIPQEPCASVSPNTTTLNSQNSYKSLKQFDSSKTTELGRGKPKAFRILKSVGLYFPSQVHLLDIRQWWFVGIPLELPKTFPKLKALA